MANTMLRVPDAEFIIDDRGGVVGIAVNGKKSFFPRVLARTATAKSHTGDLIETVLATVKIPAGVLGEAGSVRIHTLWSHTNSANNKTMKVKVGAVEYLSAVATTSPASSVVTHIYNRDNANNQVGGSGNGSYGALSAALPTGTLDTGEEFDLTITAQLALATETITLEGYVVEVLPA